MPFLWPNQCLFAGGFSLVEIRVFSLVETVRCLTHQVCVDVCLVGSVSMSDAPGCVSMSGTDQLVDFVVGPDAYRDLPRVRAAESMPFPYALYQECPAFHLIPGFESNAFSARSRLGLTHRVSVCFTPPLSLPPSFPPSPLSLLPLLFLALLSLSLPAPHSLNLPPLTISLRS